jgi:predicted dehydrogenase
MEAMMIRWGVLGAASIARRRVIPAIQVSRNGRVTAIASRDPARAQALARELDIAVAHETYDALLADPDVDAVYIPLLNHDHHRWTIAAARAGKHILCEKPFAMNAGEAEEMLAAAYNAGVLLSEGFMYRFHPRVVRLFELVRAGAIGDVRLVHSIFTIGPLAPGNSRLDPALGGGALMDLGCYAVNLARQVYGSEPLASTALARIGATGVDETFGAVLRFPSGGLCGFDVSLTSQLSVQYEVVGSSGRLAVPHGFRPETNKPTELILERGMEREVIAIEPADHYRLMFEDFADAILEGRQPRYGPEDAVANMRVIDALQAAARATA